MTQRVKNLLAVQETWVPPLGSDDPLEEDMVAHPGILAWRAPWTEEPGGRATVRWVAESRTRLGDQEQRSTSL